MWRILAHRKLQEPWRVTLWARPSGDFLTRRASISWRHVKAHSQDCWDWADAERRSLGPGTEPKVRTMGSGREWDDGWVARRAFGGRRRGLGERGERDGVADRGRRGRVAEVL